MPVNIAGQTPIDQLRQRQQLAQALAFQQQDTSNPIAAGIGALANILAARGARRLGDQIAEQEAAQRQSDISILKDVLSGQADISQIGAIRDPQITGLAAALTQQAMKPQPLVPVGPGENLLDPTTRQVVYENPNPRPFSGTPTGTPGLLFDNNTRQVVDVMALQGNPQQGGQSSQGIPPPAERYETPNQKRQRDTEAAATKEQAKLDAKAEADLKAAQRANLEGAQATLAKVGKIRSLITEAKEAGVDPDSLFGALQSGEGFVGGMVRGAGKVLGTDAEKYRRRLERELANMELDVAKMKLKNQGTVTDAERAIARQTLPTLSLPDAASAEQVLQDMEAEANSLIGAGGDILNVSGQNTSGVIDRSPVVLKGHPQYGDVTEADIARTAAENNMTVEQVIEMLNGR